MPAGYSKTPLAKKLGIREDTEVVALGAPPSYVELLDPLPAGVTIRSSLRNGERSARFVHVFEREGSRLEADLPRLVRALAKDGTLWISWPKKAAAKKLAELETDLDREGVRDLGLGAGLVDTKVCAVDEVWSGLKFVFRLKDR